MIVTLAPRGDVRAVQAKLAALGLWTTEHRAFGRVQLLVEPHSSGVDPGVVRAVDGVESVAVRAPIAPKLERADNVVRIGEVALGSGLPPVVMAGPCAVESEEQIHEAAKKLGKTGVRFLRGGAFKPRTSPYSFEGHGERALRWMREAADAHGLLVVTEAMAPEQVPSVAMAADLIQVGSRNMYNYPLLHAVGAVHKPVLLKRAFSATIDEWLLAAEHCLSHGAAAIILCERGIRGFDSQTRNVLDLGAVALLAHVHRLPVVVDPSHAAGRRDLVRPMSRAAVAAGAAGLLIEVHDAPGNALSDGPQALGVRELRALLDELGVVASEHERSHAWPAAHP